MRGIQYGSFNATIEEKAPIKSQIYRGKPIEINMSIGSISLYVSPSQTLQLIDKLTKSLDDYNMLIQRKLRITEIKDDV